MMFWQEPWPVFVGGGHFRRQFSKVTLEFVAGLNICQRSGEQRQRHSGINFSRSGRDEGMR
jgi:hypothetical protein